MRSFVVSLVVALGFLVGAGAPVSGQDQEEKSSGVDQEKSYGSTAVLRGSEVPKYLQVESFFWYVLDNYNDGESWYEGTVLRELGLEPRSDGAEAITRAAVLAGSVMEEVFRTDVYDLDSGEDRLAQEELFMEDQFRFKRRKIRSVTSIYRTMLIELGAAGIDSAIVDDLIERQIAPGMVVATNEPGGFEGIENKELFKIIKEEFGLKGASEKWGIEE